MRWSSDLISVDGSWSMHVKVASVPWKRWKIEARESIIMKLICTVRPYLAVVMILCYQPDLRAKQKRVWDNLNYAWAAKFGIEMTAACLELWPEFGPHA